MACITVLFYSIDPNGTYVDVTFGGGGHSREILSRLSSRGRLIAFDQDADAMANAPCDKRFTLIHNNFKYLHSCLRAAGCPSVDGILADLGVSSHHFDTPERGFSFRFEGQKLDMRLNQSAERSAENVVNESTIENLAQIFGRYGELDNPFRIAKAIQAARPIADIDALLAAVGGVAPRAAQAKFHAKLFQALRVEVNGEMQALEMMLRGALASLKDGGVLSVIAYHSLEDRMVK
ncbi:MAG: 16S rRNA (cytosine(1402)-N(4))-methyltransferase RsmH, partial [Mucinivorans sp.]